MNIATKKAREKEEVNPNCLAIAYPEIAKQWHPKKNGTLTPFDVSGKSIEKAWWLLSYDDPKTGKHFNFEWQATIRDRTVRNVGCPYLCGKAVLIGFNDLASNFPNIAKEWHPKKNGNLTPFDVSWGSNKKVWWLLSYDDPKTGKHFDFEWQATISSRTSKNISCPYLSGQAVWTGFNDLATTHPYLAKQWHPKKNGNLTPFDVTYGCRKKVWWLLSYDDPKTGKHFDFEWQAKIGDRALKDNTCPYLYGRAIWVGFNDLATTHPYLAKQWHPKKNGKLTPFDVSCGNHKKVWWLLPYDDPITGKHFDFEWEAPIDNRALSNNNCPYLSGKAVWIGFNDLATNYPEIAKDWDNEANYPLTPYDVTYGSGKRVSWKQTYVDPKTNQVKTTTWIAAIYDRTLNGTGNPNIKNSSRLETLLKDILEKYNIEYTREKKFDGCKNSQALPFDFFLDKQKMLVETDGAQHFESIEFWGGNKGLLLTKKRDSIKNTYCQQNDIPLLRIPYIFDPVKDKEKIEKIVLDFINTQRIPQEIVDFYRQQEGNTYVEVCVERKKKLAA